MSKFRIGAWALESERAEAEERERAEAAAATLPISSSGYPMLLAGQPAQSFPSLQEAATKPKKKKAIPMSISEFNTGTHVGPGGAYRAPAFKHKSPTPGEMLYLPTGPRERTAEELEQSRLNGRFRSYCYGTGGGSGRIPLRSDVEFRLGAAPSRDSNNLPSRADEMDNWASTKKFTPTMGFGRQERSGSFGNGGLSKADEVDNWSFGKKSTAPLPNGCSGFGTEFRDSRRGSGGSLLSNVERERPRLILDPPKRDSALRQDPVLTRPSPFGSARPREEVLAEKGLDWRKMETEIEAKRALRPTSSQSSRQSSVQSSRPGSSASWVSGEAVTPKPRPKVSPFGGAKPREVLLEEKGMDWRKIDRDLEHRRVERPDTDEEKILKEEIDQLRNIAKKNEREIDCDSAPSSTEQISSLRGQIDQREKELNKLIQHLDDKVRFGQRASNDIRPGSGSGRIPFPADRPPSQSCISDDSRNSEFMERPHSRGMGDIWSRPLDKQRRFQRSRPRDSVFLYGRSSDRSSKNPGRW